jgi:hypothetical protein
MLLIIHALLGSILGIHLHSAALIIFLGILSHFLLDMIPHWDGNFDKEHFRNYSMVNFNKRLIYLHLAESIFTAIFIYSLYATFSDKFMLLGAIAAILPDLANVGYLTRLRYKKSYKKYLHFHNDIQKDTGFMFGITTQIILLIIFLKILF